MSVRRIFKYELVPGEQVLGTPGTPALVHVGLDGRGESCVWAEVDSTAALQRNEFKVVATGEAFDGACWEHKGTWRQGVLVWHLLSRRR